MKSIKIIALLIIGAMVAMVATAQPVNNDVRRIDREPVDISMGNNQNTDSKIRLFLSENKGINSNDLVLVSQDNTNPKSGEISILKYNQLYKGIPIYSSSIITGIRDNKIITIKSRYFKDINVNTNPSKSEVDVANIIGADSGIIVVEKPQKFNINNKKAQKNAIEIVDKLTKQAATIEDSKLIIFPKNTATNINEYRLAYKLELSILKSPPAKWVYIIDANTGEILTKYNVLISEADGADLVTENNIVFGGTTGGGSGGGSGGGGGGININGTVTADILPEYSTQSKATVGVSNEILYMANDTNAFWSNKGDNYHAIMYTYNPINITNASLAYIQYNTKYDIESFFDSGGVYISTDGTTYYPVRSYTGTQLDWSLDSIDLTPYIGQQIWVALTYDTDVSVVKDGWYIDNFKIITNNGTIFIDQGDNFSNWWVSGFSIVQQTIEYEMGTTETNGYYNIALPNNYNLKAYLKGRYVRTINYSGVDSSHQVQLTTPTTHNWNWSEYDTSYKNEQSNVYYHVNNAHTLFTKGYPFNIGSMNYQVGAYIQYIGTCNAYSDGTNIYFLGAGGGCEASSLFSDIIYHEYTHSVVNHIYSIPPPYSGQSGALNEGWADYFAGTINNNSCMNEGWIGTCTRNLNNTNRYPENIIGEVHEDGKIVSGAAWDLRGLTGNETADGLIINAMKLEPLNFTEYLDDVITVDDDNANAADGTPHLLEICTAFQTNHGINSPYCRFGSGTITRSFSAPNVRTNEMLVVTLTPHSDLTDSPFDTYQVTEKIPMGFTVIASTATISQNNAAYLNHAWTFNVSNSPNGFTYTVIAQTTGDKAFSGTFGDENSDTGVVSGEAIVVVTDIADNLELNEGTTNDLPLRFKSFQNTGMFYDTIKNTWNFVHTGKAILSITKDNILAFSTGNPLKPSYSFIDNPGTGMWYDKTNQELKFAYNGSSKLILRGNKVLFLNSDFVIPTKKSSEQAPSIGTTYYNTTTHAMYCYEYYWRYCGNGTRAP